MKLNKHQKAWIDRLRSGKSRKCKNRLKDGKGAYCCLGVGIITCGDTIPTDRDVENLKNHISVVNTLRLKSCDGEIDINKVNKKWRDKLEFYSNSSLVEINDETFLTHKEIGDFINENREAVFNK